jgi:hypothetical protein
MTQHCRHLVAMQVFTAIFLWWNPTAGADELEYKERANRFEGVRPKPVGGFNVELLSARVDYHDDPETLGEQFHARFFLERASDVKITVRELDYKRYYWLDKIKPQSPWQVGFGNVFHWPTSDVVRPLNLRISDLGIVVRLGNQEPGEPERVAPVAFYQSQFPSDVKGYVFSFRLREDAKVNVTVYKGDEKYYESDPIKVRGKRSFPFKWDLAAKPPPEGEYKVVLSGYELSANDPVHLAVQFYHRPLIK